jgi:hypothetical protein
VNRDKASTDEARREETEKGRKKAPKTNTHGEQEKRQAPAARTCNLQMGDKKLPVMECLIMAQSIWTSNW